MPRPPQTKALDEALEKPHAARPDVAQACEGMLVQRDLRAGEQTLATWHQAAEAVQKEAYVVYDNAHVDCDDQLYASASGRARRGLHDMDWPA